MCTAYKVPLEDVVEAKPRTVVSESGNTLVPN